MRARYRHCREKEKLLRIEWSLLHIKDLKEEEKEIKKQGTKREKIEGGRVSGGRELKSWLKLLLIFERGVDCQIVYGISRG